MPEAIAAALAVINQVLVLINTENARKYIDRIVELQLDIQKENAKGYLSDDPKIEALNLELQVVIEAAGMEIANVQAKKS